MLSELVTLLDLLRSIIALGRAPLPSQKSLATFCVAIRATQVGGTAAVTSDKNRYYTWHGDQLKFHTILASLPRTSLEMLYVLQLPRKMKLR